MLLSVIPMAELSIYTDASAGRNLKEKQSQTSVAVIKHGTAVINVQWTAK